MAQPNDNGGTTPSVTQASPGSPEATNGALAPDVQQKLSDLERQAQEGVKAKKDLEELQNYFGQRRELYDAALLYDKDPQFQKVVKDYVSSGGTPAGAGQDPTPSLDLSFLDETQRKALNQYIEQAIGSRMKPVDDTISQLKGYVTQSQINDMRGKYTKEKGYPFAFQEVESEIASLINNGQATSADAAYLQLVGSRYPGIRTELDKTIKEQKRQISMSRYTAPTNYPIKRGSEGPKTFLDAIRQAEEQIGL